MLSGNAQPKPLVVETLNFEEIKKYIAAGAGIDIILFTDMQAKPQVETSINYSL